MPSYVLDYPYPHYPHPHYVDGRVTAAVAPRPPRTAFRACILPQYVAREWSFHSCHTAC